MAEPVKPGAAPVWRTHLQMEEQDAARYPDAVNKGLLEVIAGTPRRALELGCARGAFGAELKTRFPGVHVTGIEAGEAPAAVAATRLDRVFRARLDDIDLAAQGIAAGEFDLVIAADVLEHLVNPWDLLVRLKPFIAADGQVVASIPNIRNALVVAALAVNGRWRYTENGFLDITHLRFFTFEEIRAMFEETGYRIDGNSANMSQPLAGIFQENRGNEKVTMNLGRLTLADLNPREFYEMCVDQFLVRARPA